MERLRRVHSLWSWLPAFRAVAETEHLPSASRNFGVSASALSRTLALLEENVGQPLFHRSGRRIELNPAGADLLTSVRRAMRMIHDTLARLEHEQLVGPLLLAARGLAAESLALAALPKLRARAPELTPQLRELPAERVAGALLRGELDVALVESLIRHPELTTIPAADGFPMPASILRPLEPALGAKRVPVIVHVYGGPSAPLVSNAWSRWTLFDQLLVARGIAVVRVDNRSATAISKTLENSILGAGYGEGELDDLLAAVRWLKGQSWVDGDRVGIWGWSGGGSFTLSAMTRSKEFRAGIAVAAVTDWRYYDTKWAEAFMKLPEDNAEGYLDTAHAARAADLHGRLLLVHGTFDDNVHIQNCWRFADELVAAGKLFEMMVYPRRKHGIDDAPARVHLARTMLRFWEANL